jgi:hypothetical protein
LSSFFKEENERLEEYLRIDLSRWWSTK